MEEALLACQAIGYPIMLKASWGGGGKGIRKVGAEALGREAASWVTGVWLFSQRKWIACIV